MKLCWLRSKIFELNFQNRSPDKFHENDILATCLLTSYKKNFILPSPIIVWYKNIFIDYVDGKKETLKKTIKDTFSFLKKLG